MAKKKTTKKTKTAAKSAKKSLAGKKQTLATELMPNELRIKFDHPDQLLPGLLELAKSLSETHEAVLLNEAVALEVDVLGAARARLIVSSCAQSTAWGATLSDLLLNPLIFRNCVANGVDQAGYVPPPIPATPNTRLIDVVIAIQGAPHK